MKVLIFGPSGSGKRYIAHSLQQAGINAYDADEIKSLSAWY
jgi:adenylate kinase family enzyme